MTHGLLVSVSASLTAFADADVTLPLAGAVTAVLLAVRRADLAWRWMAAAGAALGTILALKLAFGIVLSLGAAIAVRSPSGHTCSSSLVYGTLALLLLGNRHRAGTAVAVLVAVIEGTTRIVLGAHSLSEVAIGGSVGTFAVAMLGRRVARRPPLRPFARLLLVAATVAVVWTFYGDVAAIEGRLDQIEYGAARSLGLPTWSGQRVYFHLYGGG